MQKMYDPKVTLLAIAATVALLATAMFPWAGAGPIPDDHHPSFETTAQKGGAETASWSRLSASISPDGTSVLSGSSTEFHATPDTNGDQFAALSWSWSLGEDAPGVLSSTDGSTATFLASSVASAATTSLTVNVGGLDLTYDGAYFAASYTVTVQVVPLMVAGPIGADHDPAIPGSQVSLSFSVSGGLPPMKVAWEFGDGTSANEGISSDGTVSIDHVYQEGTYTPSATIGDAVGESYDTSATSTLVVTSTMAASISAPPSGDAGTFVEVSASVSGGAPPYEFQWSDSAGDTSFSANSWYLKLASAAVLDIALSVTDSLGARVSASSVTVEVNQDPTIGVSALSRATDVGTPFPLEINITGGTPPYQVSWTDPTQDASFSSAYPARGTYVTPYSFRQPGDVVVEASVTDSDAVQAGSDGMVGRIVPQPAASLEVFPSSPTVGVPMELTGTLSGGVLPYSYAFTFSGMVSSHGATSGNLSEPGTVTWTGALTSSIPVVATLDVTDSGGGITSASMTISAVQVLQASSTIAPQRGEVGRPLTADVYVTGGTSPYSYSIGGSDGESVSGILQNSGEQAVQLMPSIAGNLTYSLAVSDSAGRSTTSTSTIPVAPPLSTYMDWTPSSVDVGDSLNVTVIPGGGWSPYSGTLTTSSGGIYFLSGLTGSADVTIPVPTSEPILLTVSLTDAMGVTAMRSTTVHVNPRPTVTLLASPTGTEVGLPVTFTALVHGGTAPYETTIYFGDGGHASGSGVEHVYTRPGTYLANATVQDATGVKALTAMVDVTVAPTPQVFAAASPPSTDVGRGISFSSSVTFGTAPYSYRWSFGDGGASADADPTHTYSLYGLYRVELEVTDALGETGSSEVLNITVSPPPAIDVVANRTTVDVGEEVNLEATSLGGSLPLSFLFSFGDGQSSWGTNATHTFVSAGTYTVVVELTDGAGASASTSLSVQVDPTLSPAAIGASPPIGEVGSAVTLTEEPIGGTQPFRLSWNLGNLHANVTGSTGWTFDPSQPGLFSGSVTIADATGMTVSTSFAVRVDRALSLNLTAHGLPTEVGIPRTLDAGILGGVAPYSIAWTLPSGTVSHGNSTTLTVTPSAPGPLLVSVSVMDSLGITLSGTVLLEVAAGVTLTLPPSSIVGDAGVPFSLPITVSGGVGTVNLSVSTPSGDERGSLTLLFAAPGAYPLSVSACDALGALVTLHANVTIVPSLSVSLQGDPTTVPTGENEPYDAKVSGGAGPLSERWESPGMPSWGGPSANLTFADPGTHRVVFSVTDSAGDSEAVTLNVTALVDPLALSLNASELTGLAPFAPAVTLDVNGGTSPTHAYLTLNGAKVATLTGHEATWEWLGRPMLPQSGTYDLEAQVVDSLGKADNASLLLAACSPLAAPSLDPAEPTAAAGMPLTLTVTTGVGLCPGAAVEVHWWGPGLISRSGPSVTFLGNSTGARVDHVSEELRLVSGGILQNLTMPFVVDVRAGPAVDAVLANGGTVGFAGNNISLLYHAIDWLGNVNTTANGSILLTGLNGDVASVAGTFVEGSALLRWSDDRAEWQNFSVVATFDSPSSLDVLWVANPDRALLKVLSLETVGSDLLVNVSVTDIYGNPLSNITIEAVVPGLPPATANATDGAATLFVRGGAGASSLSVKGPDGAVTTVNLSTGADHSADTLASTLVGAALFAVALALVLLWVRGRRKNGGHESGRAERVVTRLLEKWPDEDRESLLAMAEEANVPPEEAAGALRSLERRGKAVKAVDEEGIERWKIVPPDEDLVQKEGGPPGFETDETPEETEGGVEEDPNVAEGVGE